MSVRTDGPDGGVPWPDVLEVFAVRGLIDPERSENLQKYLGPWHRWLWGVGREPSPHDPALHSANQERERVARVDLLGELISNTAPQEPCFSEAVGHRPSYTRFGSFLHLGFSR